MTSDCKSCLAKKFNRKDKHERHKSFKHKLEAGYVGNGTAKLIKIETKQPQLYRQIGGFAILTKFFHGKFIRDNE